MRTPMKSILGFGAVALSLLGCAGHPGGGSGGSGGGGPEPKPGDPGTEAWIPVAADRIRDDCKLDPTVLGAIKFSVPWLVVRYGKVCWAGGGALSDLPAQNFSTT